MTYVNSTAAESRRPRTLVQVSGQDVPFTSATVEHFGTYQAGTFSVEFNAEPDQWGYWLGQDVIGVEIYTGFPTNPDQYTAKDLTLLFSGRVDQLDFDPENRQITFAGRDYTSLFTDAQTDGQFYNRTASQVAELFAASAGLDTNIQPTTTLIGTYYTADHVHLNRSVTQWSILTYLAREEQVQCFVLGKTLYFGKFQNNANQQYLIKYDPVANAANAVKLKFEHDLTLSRDVVVQVHSSNHSNVKGFTVTAKIARTATVAAKNASTLLPKSAAQPQIYSVVIPGLTPAQAKIKAYSLLQEISLHELRMDCELPGDDLLYPWVTISVHGTGTKFDATYFPVSVQRYMTANDYSMTVSAKNHNALNQTTP